MIGSLIQLFTDFYLFTCKASQVWSKLKTMTLADANIFPGAMKNLFIIFFFRLSYGLNPVDFQWTILFFPHHSSSLLQVALEEWIENDCTVPQPPWPYVLFPWDGLQLLPIVVTPTFF